MRHPSSSRPVRLTRKKSGGGTLIGMFIGLVLGVAIAALVVWMLNHSPVPFQKPPTQAEASMAANARGPGPAALPGKPGDPVPEKRFQFYDILPGKADAVPDKPAADSGMAGTPPKEVKETPKETKKEEAKKEEPKKEEPKQPLFIQTGSFSSAHDADNQKANLALMGVEATVQQVMVQDKTYYRVRVGPFQKLEELNKVRAELAKSGVEASLVKH